MIDLTFSHLIYLFTGQLSSWCLSLKNSLFLKLPPYLTWGQKCSFGLVTHLRAPVWWHRNVRSPQTGESRQTHTQPSGLWRLVPEPAGSFLSELLWDSPAELMLKRARKVFLGARWHVFTYKFVASSSDITSVCSGSSHRNTNPQRVAVAHNTGGFERHWKFQKKKTSLKCF